TVDRAAVAGALPKGSVLVEFVCFPLIGWHRETSRKRAGGRGHCYGAFVLPADEPDSVAFIDLGDADGIDDAITTFLAGLVQAANCVRGRDLRRRKKPAPTSDDGARLYARVFEPLRPYLHGRTRLLLACEDNLTRLPFEVLPTPDGRRLIDDYQISYLGCGRDVLRFGVASAVAADKPLLIADPDFNLGGQPDLPAVEVEFG